MPILRVKEIRDMSIEDRKKRLHELQTELVRLKTMIKAGGAIENPSRIRELRKTIARILTVESAPAPPPKKEKEEKKAQKKAEKKKKATKKEKEGKKKE